MTSEPNRYRALRDQEVRLRLQANQQTGRYTEDEYLADLEKLLGESPDLATLVGPNISDTPASECLP